MPDLVRVDADGVILPPVHRQPTLQGKPPFPSLIDNTMRGDFILCPRKWMYGFLYQLAPLHPNVHLHAGGAFAKALEIGRKAFYIEGKSEADSLRLGLEALINAYGNVQFPPTKNGDKSLENVVRAYDSYMRKYRLGQDPIKPYKGMIEFNFAMQTEVKNPSTGDPILLGGRCDMIGEMHGLLYVTDEKTTTSLGDQWAGQWDLDSQFTTYCAAAREHGVPVAGAVVRGIGLLKTKITHAEAIIQRAQWEIDRWWEQLHKDLKRMVRAWEDTDFDVAISKHACSAYGSCAFKIMCQSPDPERWLNQYRIRVWDPLAKDFGEKLLENPVLMETPSEELSIDFDKLV